MLQELNCTIPGFDLFIKAADLKECSDKQSAAQMFQKYLDIRNDFQANKTLYGCPSACTTILFDVNTFFYHSNTLIETKEVPELPSGTFQFSFSYSSLQVEEKVVTLVYDLESVLASIGGNLGLFLGFSCLSLMLLLLKYTKKMIKQM